MAQIVVIDDDDEIRKLFQVVLERAGHHVATARDGHEGINLVLTSQAQVVITDLVMPSKEGLETITELRRRFRNVAIIAMSGALMGSYYLEMAARLGAERTLLKPFPPRALLDAIAELADSHHFTTASA